MSALAALNRSALSAYDVLAEGGVSEPTRPSDPCLIAFRTAEDRRPFVDELEAVRAAGQEVDFELLTGVEARDREPALADHIGAAVVVHGQRYLNPGAYLATLGDAIRTRGGKIIDDAEVVEVRDHGDSVRATTSGESDLRADVAVLAAGAWVNRLASKFGVRMPVQSGRGYSFSLPSAGMPTSPTYFAGQRVVCTPMGDRVRVAGMMEFTSPDRPRNPRRIQAIVDAARPLLRDVDWDQRTHEWVGPRPCTADGLPLVGPTRSPRVHLCGGHGMWGIALGPVTGKLLADSIITGRPAPELAPLHPLR
jgi:D-amino-acid dehydrogenase